VFLCVAVAAFVYNMRFFLAYVDLVRGNNALEHQKFEEGVALLASASHRVPEVPELATIPNLFEAGRLIKEEKDAEALALLEKTTLPPKSELKDMYRDVELQARLGVAFEKHDYDQFLELAEQLQRMHPNEPGATGAVASAYACKYAVTGDNLSRERALLLWEEAKKQAGTHLDIFGDFENRLQYRLQTRDIINRKEFARRFPNGWKPEGAK
jgi:hypothetical protein